MKKIKITSTNLEILRVKDITFLDVFLPQTEQKQICANGSHQWMHHLALCLR